MKETVTNAFISEDADWLCGIEGRNEHGIQHS